MPVLVMIGVESLKGVERDNSLAGRLGDDQRSDVCSSLFWRF